MSSNQFDQDKISRFMSNESSSEEANEVADFLSNSTSELDKILVFEKITNDEIISLTLVEKDEIMRTIIPSKVPKIHLWKKWAAAACLIGALSIGGYYILFQDKNDTGIQISTIQSKKLVDNYSRIEKLYSFPDSSTAILQPNASLEHAHDFLVNRTIHQLTGDVYYAVQKDSIHAFQVLANGIITTAIGTEFRVRNHAKNNQVEITLVEGKVKLSSVDVDFAMDDIYLDPGQVCFIDKTSGKISIDMIREEHVRASKSSVNGIAPSSVNTAGIIWTNTEIQFNKVKLENVFKRIESQYGLKINYVDTGVANSLITGKILRSDSLETILKSICEINQLTFEINQNTIYIKRK